MKSNFFVVISRNVSSGDWMQLRTKKKQNDYVTQRSIRSHASEMHLSLPQCERGRCIERINRKQVYVETNGTNWMKTKAQNERSTDIVYGWCFLVSLLHKVDPAPFECDDHLPSRQHTSSDAMSPTNEEILRPAKNAERKERRRKQMLNEKEKPVRSLEARASVCEYSLNERIHKHLTSVCICACEEQARKCYWQWQWVARVKVSERRNSLAFLSVPFIFLFRPIARHSYVPLLNRWSFQVKYKPKHWRRPEFNVVHIVSQNIDRTTLKFLPCAHFSQVLTRN